MMDHEEMATAVKPIPRNARYALMDSLALSRKGIVEVTKLHQSSMDPNMMHKLMDVIIIFQQIESTLKTIGTESEKE